MTSITAVYHDGVFEPSQPVQFVNGQRVYLNVEPIPNHSGSAWLVEVSALQKGIIRRSGELPDSTHEIAEDRLR